MLEKRVIKTRLQILIWIISCCFASQAQVVINKGGIININGGTAAANSIYLVLNKPPAANPILMTNTVSAQGIMMETEYSITQYNLALATTAITVPYLSYTLEPFPLAVTGISAGTQTAIGNIQFSSKKATTRATGWDNATYVTSDVTNGMGGYISPGNTYTVDNSMNVIDRFWIIDAQGYSTTPGASLSFSFISAEDAVNGGNTSTPAALLAMAYDRVSKTWGGYGPSGANQLPGSSVVSGVSVGTGLLGKYYRTWTLVNQTSPLPVELLAFAGTCVSNGTKITWSTASENNSNYFTLEKSLDGQNFVWLANINAAGNSTKKENYLFNEESNNGTIYYRLSETDKNGVENILSILPVNACNPDGTENIHVFSGNGMINMSVYSLSNQAVNITVYDITGRLIYKEVLSAVQGNNNYTINPTVATGIYMVEVNTNTTTLTRRVPILDK
jgi:hypothetical protein